MVNDAGVRKIYAKIHSHINGKSGWNGSLGGRGLGVEMKRL